MSITSFIDSVVAAGGDGTALCSVQALSRGSTQEAKLRTVSYPELDILTAKVAARIRQAAGAGSTDGRVVVIGHHSVDAVVAALAALRSGLTYTPLNPDLPHDRVVDLLKWLQPRVVIGVDDRWTDPALQNVPWLAAGVEVARDGKPGEGDDEPADVEPPVAYSILTSGSTGEPKLVNVSAAGIPALCQAQADAFGLAPGRTMLQFASLAFDASIAEILVALRAGATLVLPERDDRGWLSAVDTYLRSHPIDVATLPPSVHRSLSAVSQDHIATTVFVGEPVGEKDVERASRTGRVLNAYGPTEATVCATITEMNVWSRSVGQVISGFTAYVRTESGDLREHGTGELVLEGPGIALGYEQVESDAFSCTPQGARRYRTGDVVTIAPDGNISYEGRVDQQVKRLGHRVSIPELEHRWAQVLQEDVSCVRPSDGRFTCVVVGEGDAAPRMAVLRAELAPWEAPDEVIVTASVPLLVSGKTDTAALSILLAKQSATSQPAEPTESTHELVSRAVEKTLGYVPNPSVTIFDQKADSLDFVTLQAELCDLFGEVLVDAVFDDLGHDFVVDDVVAALDARREGTAAPVPAGTSLEKMDFAWISAALDEFAATLPVRAPVPGRRTVVVTGPGGFIGGKLLLACGPQTIGVTTSDPKRLRIELSERFGADVTQDLVPWAEAFNEGAVGLLAGATLVHAGFRVNHAMPIAAQWSQNVEPMLSMLRIALQVGVRRVVFLSATSAGSRFEPWGPSAWQNAKDPYSKAKLVCEEALRRAAARGLEASILRLPLVYGHSRGERHLLSDNVFLAIVKASVSIGALPPAEGAFSVSTVDDVVDRVLADVSEETPPAGVRQSTLVRAEVTAESLRTLAATPLRTIEKERWLSLVKAAQVTPEAVLARIADVLPLCGDRGGAEQAVHPLPDGIGILDAVLDLEVAR